MTTRLRFPDESTAIAALAAYRNADGWVVASHAHALDPVGVLYLPGTVDAEGNELTPPTALEGWHVNLIGAVPAAAVPYIITPAAPLRVFAGVG